MSSSDPQKDADALRAVGEEYAETLERVDHWIAREQRREPVDEVALFAYLCEQLRKLTPGTMGDSAAMAAALIIRAAKGREL